MSNLWKTFPFYLERYGYCKSINFLWNVKTILFQIQDERMCLQREPNLQLDDSSKINVNKRFTASMCIQYCKGSDLQYQYAVLGQIDCTCAFPNLENQTLEEIVLDSARCGMSSSKSMIGSEMNNGLLNWTELNRHLLALMR